MQCDPRCNLIIAGQSIQGRDLDVLRFGEEGEGKSKVWINARQHPGESMAEWFVEGLILRLLDPDNAISEALLASCVFYITPNMNPDGSTMTLFPQPVLSRARLVPVLLMPVPLTIKACTPVAMIILMLAGGCRVVACANIIWSYY